MNIYIPEPPPYLIRLQIMKQGTQTEYLTLCNTTIDEVEKMCKEVIENQLLSIFEDGRKTMINIRESKGANNGQSKNVSFRGLEPKQTLDILIKYLKK